MYTQHFGLTMAPFRITPDTRHFFGGGHRAAILDALCYVILSGEGLVKVTGEVGTGKTMLCRMLQEKLPDSVSVVYLANPGLSAQEVISAILHELGLETHASRLTQQQILQDYLLSAYRQRRKVVIFVEEAQCMPAETLEAIRLLSNLETGQDKLLQLVLFGQPELNRLLAEPSLRQLRDRITHGLELAPLTTNDVADYVRFRLHSAGYRGSELFSATACRKLAHASKGLIRRIHILANKALLAAYAERSTRVTRQHIKQAIADSEYAPRHAWLTEAWLATGLATALATVTLLSFQLTHNRVPAAAGARLATLSQDRSVDRKVLARLVNIKPGAGAPLVSSRLQASRDWLNNTDPKQLTIQVMLTDNDNAAALEKLLERPELAQLLDNLYLQETRVNGRRRWNVLYGEFSDRDSAQQVLQRLPEIFRHHKPYLRSLKALHAAVQGHEDSLKVSSYD